MNEREELKVRSTNLTRLGSFLESTPPFGYMWSHPVTISRDCASHIWPGLWLISLPYPDPTLREGTYWGMPRGPIDPLKRRHVCMWGLNYIKSFCYVTFLQLRLLTYILHHYPTIHCAMYCLTYVHYCFYYLRLLLIVVDDFDSIRFYYRSCLFPATRWPNSKYLRTNHKSVQHVLWLF